MSGGTTILELVGVGHSYRPGVPILQGVDLAVGPGELVVIYGPSGSGKTTLLHIAALLLTPDEGSLRIAGRDISALRPRALAAERRTRIGLVLQDGGLLADLTAIENVSLPMRLVGRPQGEARARARALLDSLGLADGDGDALNRYPAELSGGEIQRVALARALANDPMIVLADEPTGNLDAEAKERVVALIREVPGPGRVVILATHDPAFRHMGTRLVRLVHGRLVDDGRS